MNRIIEFVVEGQGYFPIDMLRYDCCWPATSIDVNNLLERCERPTTITLKSASEKITPERWRSFGWTVVSATDLQKRLRLILAEAPKRRNESKRRERRG